MFSDIGRWCQRFNKLILKILIQKKMLRLTVFNKEEYSIAERNASMKQIRKSEGCWKLIWKQKEGLQYKSQPAPDMQKTKVIATNDENYVMAQE